MAQLRAAANHRGLRRGWAVNWKRVYRLMGEDNLLWAEAEVVVTTDSNHGRKVYPNLAREMG